MEEYMTIKEAAELWDVSQRWIQTLCAEEKIEGAVKFAGVWAIPKSVQRPKDSRVKSGRYVHWRKKIIPKKLAE